MTNTQPKPLVRIGSMLLDHVVMTFAIFPFSIPVFISTFSRSMNMSHVPQSYDMFGSWMYLILIGFALYFCKDCINGRSVAKRALNLQVVDYKTGAVASPLKCFVRNIFCVFWPIEVIVALVNPSRRIGDFVAGTSVEVYNAEIDQPKPKFAQALLSVVIAYVMLLIVILPVNAAMNQFAKPDVVVVESSINESAARRITTILEENYGNNLSADVRVYDQIEGDSDMAYISVIIDLKQDYFEYDSDYKSLQNAVESVLYTQYQKETFVGQVKYVYKAPGRFEARTTKLDWRILN